MLGIRSYKNCAFDSWVGPRKDFFCDLIVTDQKPQGSDEDSLVHVLADKEGFVLFYKKLKEEKKSLRHLAFETSDKEGSFFSDPEKVISWVKGLVDSKFFESTKRITLVSSTLVLHDLFQQELFQVF